MYSQKPYGNKLACLHSHRDLFRALTCADRLPELPIYVLKNGKWSVCLG